LENVPLAGKKTQIPASKGQGAMDGTRYLESLRDGREIWVNGEKIQDVTTHPYFATVAKEIARLYDLQYDPATQDDMTYVNESGLRVSYSYLLPQSPEDLLARRRNTEVWARESFGMMGRFPDFCAAMIVGMYDVRAELAKINPAFATNIENYLHYARSHDLSISHGLHDPARDKSKRPEEDPDRCLRIVEERDDGLVVRGARFVTLGPLTNELIIAPTQILNEREGEFALWFALPVATPGVKLICREPLSRRQNPDDHLISMRFDEQDVIVIFDDVFVPRERVFLARDPEAANTLFRRRVMPWAGYVSGLQLLARMELLIGVGHLIAETGGMSDRPNIMLELGELVTYKQVFASILRAAEIDGTTTSGGHYAPARTLHLRSMIAQASERIVQILEHIGSSSLIFTASANDLNTPELQPFLEKYYSGKDTDAMTRQKLCKLGWELTGDSFGGRQQLYERLHSGSPDMITSNVYRLYDKTNAVAMVERLLDL